MPNPRNSNGPLAGLSALGLVGQLGLVMSLPIVGGVLAGVYLDGWLGGGGALVAVGVLVGIGAGIAGVYGILKRETTWKR
jgi:hypothetical protein